MKTVRRRLAPVVAAVLLAAAALPVLAQDVEPPEVVLLDPGSEPRVLLRYEVTEGHVLPFELSLDQDMRMTSQGRTSPWFDSPPITIHGMTTVVGINDDGTYELETVVDDIEVGDDGDPAMVEALRAQMATIIGMATRVRLDRRGLALEQETAMPEGYVAPPGVQPGMFDAQSAPVAQPLPEEPVGQGAVWEVRLTSAAGGVELTTTSTVTLEELSPDGFTASIDLRVDAPSQAWVLPGLPPRCGGHPRPDGGDGLR